MFLGKGGLFATGRPWCPGAKQPRIKQTGMAVWRWTQFTDPWWAGLGQEGRLRAWMLGLACELWPLFISIVSGQLLVLVQSPEGLKRMKRQRTDKCTLSALSGDLHLLLPSDICAPSPAFRLRQGFTPSAPWSSGLQPPTESHHLLSRVSSLQMADLSAIII